MSSPFTLYSMPRVYLTTYILDHRHTILTDCQPLQKKKYGVKQIKGNKQKGKNPTQGSRIFWSLHCVVFLAVLVSSFRDYFCSWLRQSSGTIGTPVAQVLPLGHLIKLWLTSCLFFGKVSALKG